MSILDRLLRIIYIQLMKEFNSGRKDSYSKKSGGYSSREKFDEYYEKYKYYREKYRGSGYEGSSRGGSYTGKKSEEEKKLAQYYANLELPYGAGMDEVKKAWKRLLMKYHPDKHQDKEKVKTATVLTQKLNEAYFYIKNYWKNKKFDK